MRFLHNAHAEVQPQVITTSIRNKMHTVVFLPLMLWVNAISYFFLRYHRLKVARLREIATRTDILCPPNLAESTSDTEDLETNAVSPLPGTQKRKRAKQRVKEER